jgi:NAD dependent epimerase/dehydratase family
VARIVFTGGAGFLGSHLCERLLARGDEVVAVDSLLTGSRENVRHLLGSGGFTLLQTDISEAWDVEGVVDGVMNLASPASPIDYARCPWKRCWQEPWERRTASIWHARRAPASCRRPARRPTVTRWSIPKPRTTGKRQSDWAARDLSRGQTGQ